MRTKQRLKAAIATKKHTSMADGASPLAGINKVLSVDSGCEVILIWPSLFVLFPPECYPITVFA